VLVGVETHVCILHTVLDLLADDYRVYLPTDALGSRAPLDHDTALRRLEKLGAILTTSETVAFEWLSGAQHPRFKEISALIQTRMREMS
jgi:nicotinamidase-related amidase